MNASTRTARRIVKARKTASKKRCISTYVGKAVKDAKTAEAVTNALRSVAKKLRDGGDLGKVQTRTGVVACGTTGKIYRYNACQMATITAKYAPRKAEYKTVRAAMLGA